MIIKIEEQTQILQLKQFFQDEKKYSKNSYA